MIKPITPESILPDDQDFVEKEGIRTRKASMAAVLGNLDVLDSPTTSATDKAVVFDMIKKLMPGLVLAGLNKHFQCRHPAVQQMIDECEKRVRKN